MVKVQSYTRSISCSKAKLWSVLADVPNWPKWDPDLQESKVTVQPDPSTPLNVKGTLKMKFSGNPVFEFHVHEADLEGYVAYKTTHFGATMDWFWDFRKTQDNGDLILEEGVKFDGGLSGLYNWFMGAKCVEAFEHATLNLKNICEEKPVAPDAEKTS